MNAALEEVNHAIQTFDKAIAEVIKQPRGPKRWRAAHNLWLSLSFKNQKTYREVCAENAHTRTLVNKHGQAMGTDVISSDKTLRNSLNIPVGAYIAISKADPDAFKIKSNGIKMMKTFPEYCTREAV